MLSFLFSSIPCNTSEIFCGLKGQLYPDKRDMGFPFDRLCDSETIEDFTKLVPNMKLGHCTIIFTDTIVTRTE